MNKIAIIIKACALSFSIYLLLNMIFNLDSISGLKTYLIGLIIAILMIIISD